jgi:hypothetical protein
MITQAVIMKCFIMLAAIKKYYGPLHNGIKQYDICHIDARMVLCALFTHPAQLPSHLQVWSKPFLQCPPE